MAELNLCHIDQITTDVKMQEIGFSHLFHDLVDHICCDVEFHMQQGMSFEEAYNMVKAKIGFRGLKKIQEDTLYVVDSKYRNMKKLMKISGVSGTIMLGCAAIFKLNHWPLAGILLTLGAFTLAFLFLPSALIVLWKETKNQKKLILFISAFIAGATFIFGMLFKIQHWPMANFLISLSYFPAIFLFLPSLLVHLYQDPEKKHKRAAYVIGSISVLLYTMGFWFRVLHWPLAAILLISGGAILSFVAIPMFTFIQWKDEKQINARFIFMIIAPMLFILPGALVNLNLEKNYEAGFYNTLENQDALIKIQNEANIGYLTIYSDSIGFPAIQSIHQAASQLITTIDLMEQNMLKIANDSSGSDYISLLELPGSRETEPLSFSDMKIHFNDRQAPLLLSPGSKARNALDTELKKFKDLLIKQNGIEWVAKYDSFLNSTSYISSTDTEGKDIMFLPGINSLLLMKSGVLLTESAALKKVISISK